jgi:hypothetical protein
MPEAQPLTRSEIESYLREVADILGPDGATQVIIVVGGALLARYGLRPSTLDVDSVREFDAELTTAVEEVAKRHDLRPDWLNYRAAPYRPATMEPDAGELWLEHGRLRVVAAPLQQVFLMKLYALGSRSADYSDMVRLWPHADFISAEQAVDEYWRAFPHAPADEHLIELVEGIIAEATQ